jgi:two-component system alkaline phosphatase synthesis response regulator PhoP
MAKNVERLLLVEDDRAVARIIKTYFDKEGFKVQAFGSGEEALEHYFDQKYALVILDWMLPGISGIEVCRQLRASDPNTPLIMLSARSEEKDRVRGLDAGCDDYVVKPFGIRELGARVRAVLRRYERAQQIARGKGGGIRIEIGDLVIDRDKRTVTVKDRPVDLTVKEYDLLCLLASNPGRTYSRRQLLDLLWDHDAEIFEHAVNSHVNRLRAKIEEDPRSPRYVQTVWGFGYRFPET